MTVSDLLRLLVAVLESEDVKDVVVDAISDSRDLAQRIDGERDSAEILEDVIEAARAAADNPANQQL